MEEKKQFRPTQKKTFFPLNFKIYFPVWVCLILQIAVYVKSGM